MITSAGAGVVSSVPTNAIASIAASQSLDLGFIGDLRAVDALTGTTEQLDFAVSGL